MNITCPPYRAYIENRCEFNVINWDVVKIFLEMDASTIIVECDGSVGYVEWTRTLECDPVVVANVLGSAFYDVDQDKAIWRA